MAIPNRSPKEVNPILNKKKDLGKIKEIIPGRKVASVTKQINPKKAAEKAAKEATEKLMKMGKVGTTVGIGAAIIAGLNKNKGRQSNSQLYGQKGY